MDWMMLAGSLLAILVLAGVAWALKLGRGERIASAEAAAEAAEHALAGFVTVGAVVGADGAGALAVAEDGRVAAMKLHGARIAVRAVDWSAVRAGAEGVIVETGERRFGRVTLKDVTALDMRRLAPAGDMRRLAPQSTRV
jgi:hypothetical protein